MSRKLKLKPGKATHNYHWVVSEELMARIKDYCDSNDVKSVSSIIAVAVNKYLKQEGF